MTITNTDDRSTTTTIFTTFSLNAIVVNDFKVSTIQILLQSIQIKDRSIGQVLGVTGLLKRSK
jgi:predicted transglutaminase-like protease